MAYAKGKYAKAISDRSGPKDDNEAFVVYVNNGFNNSSMLPSASDNILGTSLESFEMTSSTGEVTISIS